MNYDLFIGDYAYSSWSLRGWLLLHRFGLPCTTTLLDFTKGSIAEQMPEMFPARTVPALKTPDGAVIWDSLAMAEELATHHPDAGIWPSDPAARAMARSIAAEMHSSYGALRNTCPMNVRTGFLGFEPDKDVRADIDRIDALWTFVRGKYGAPGPWLFGEYSAADAFFAPAAARIAGFSITCSDTARAYVEAHLNDPAFRRWRALGMVQGAELEWYTQPYTPAAWPGPVARAAKAVETGPSENAECPYSGKPVRHFMELDGRVFGFCNATCRDKTVADPEAWPAFMALVNT